KDIVQGNIDHPSYAIVESSQFVSKPYRSRLYIDDINNGGQVSVSSGGSFGPGVGGGINASFSDMLGNHQLFTSLSINGEVYDFGGQVAYLYQNKRLNWGTAISHVPYVSGVQRISPDSLVVNGRDTIQVINLSTDILRTYQDQLALFTSYPFSQTQRVEAGASLSRYYYRLDRYTDYYTYDETYLTSARKRLPTPKGFNFGQVYLAYAADN